MKNYKIILFIITIFLFTSKTSFSQCREYIESIMEEELQPYVSDGNFMAITISEGDSIEVRRTFTKGQSYKVAVCGMDLFMLEIKVTDSNNNIIFKNYGNQPEITQPKKDKSKDDDDDEEEPTANVGTRFWEFTPQETSNYVITVKVPIITKEAANRVEGCLGVLVGFKK